MALNRRNFIKISSLSVAGYQFNKLVKPYWPERAIDEDIAFDELASISFNTSNQQLTATYKGALNVLKKNVINIPGYKEPVLVEGSVYHGTWLECAPHEGLVYAGIRPDIALNNHLAFFELQKEDGQFPAFMREKSGKNEIGYGQIQMVVPIAATAWDLVQQTGNNQLLQSAYQSCARWDNFLMRYRNTRGTGLCEGFCTYDTGHDNSPRWKGMANACPDHDARKMPASPGLPRLCPDLSATVYGGRVALAAMAKALGKNTESEQWHEKAESIRKLIIEKLYVPEDGAFYDLDANNQFVRVRGDLITRVLGEHVVNARQFKNVYEKQIHNPKAFWGKYPLASIALDDPAFVQGNPKNSWGGPAQALTALRATRWMEHYGKPADFAYLMQHWQSAVISDPTFKSQFDALNGIFTDDVGDYSPTALVFMDFTWRLSGVRKTGDLLEWNIRPDKYKATYALKYDLTTTAKIEYDNGLARCYINSQKIIETKDTIRLVTDKTGKVHSAVSITSDTVNAQCNIRGVIKTFNLTANQIVKA